MARILKYELQETETEIEVGSGSFPLCVQGQRDKPYVWIAVNEDSPTNEKHVFTIRLTGEFFLPRFIKENTYLGTIHALQGWAVVHVYWRRNV
jgi:hypothetical protein